MALRLSADRVQERINQERREQNMRPGLRPTADQSQRNIDQVYDAAVQQQMTSNVQQYVTGGPSSAVAPRFAEFDYSDNANYLAALEQVRVSSDQEYYDRIYRYSPPSSVTPSQFASPRTLAARRRLQKRRALELISTSSPETLDMFPTLKNIIADVPDLTEEDARNLINLTRMESAFQQIVNTDSQVVAQEVWMSMDPVMQAGFTDFFEDRFASWIEEAQKDPSWFQQGFEWLTKYVIFPSFNALMYLNETWQQVTRAQAAAVQDSPANAAMYFPSPGVGFIANSIRYWDSVAPGARDEDRLRLLRVEHGKIVDVFLDLEEKQRDGLGNAYNRWIDDWADTEFADDVAAVTFRAEENPDLIEIANKVSMTNRDKIGSLVWGELPEDWLGGQLPQTLAGVTNFGFTVFNDPTIMGTKVLMTARASRYALTKLGGPGGADEAFKYRRTRRIFNDLGRDLSRLEKIEDPKKRALARQKIDETYGGQLPADVIQDMSDFGVRNASDAYDYFKATETVTDILEGGPRFTQNELFGRLMSAQAARREPLMPGRSVVGTIASNARRNAAFLNPATKGQVAKTADLLPSEPDELATVLMGEEYAAAVGIEPRLGSELLQGSKVFGYRYSARGVASRLDRLFRNWAKAPFNMTVDIMTGKDAGKIYQWARAFVPRYHAVAIADAFRAASPGTRKRIIDGLQNSSARVRGVQYVSPEEDLLRFSAEARKGRRYSPAIDVKVRGADGVLRSVDTSVGPDLRLGMEFASTRQDVDLVGVANQLPDELAGVGSVPVFGRTFDAPDDWVAKTFAGVDEADLPERVAQWGRENGYSVVNYKRSIDVDVQPAWENGPVLYHGTSRPIGRFRPSEEPTEFPVQGFGGTQKFARFEEGVIRGDESQSLYGGIFYSTVSRDVAASYKKKKGSRRIDVSDEQGYSYGIMYNVEQEPRLYSVRWTGEAEPRFLDLDMPAPQSLRDYARGAQKFDEFGIVDDADEFTARLNELLADPNATGAQILDHIRDGAEAFDNLQSVWVRLAADGWDGYKHIGGRKAGKGKVEHDVYIFFDKDKIAVDRVGSATRPTVFVNGERLQVEFADDFVPPAEIPLSEKSVNLIDRIEIGPDVDNARLIVRTSLDKENRENRLRGVAVLAAADDQQFALRYGDEIDDALLAEAQQIADEITGEWYLRTQQLLKDADFPEYVRVWRTSDPNVPDRGVVSVTLSSRPVDTIRGDAYEYLIPRDRIIYSNQGIAGQRIPDRALPGQTPFVEREMEAFVRAEDLVRLSDTPVKTRGPVGSPYPESSLNVVIEPAANQKIVLPEMVAYGANDPLTKANMLLDNYAATGREVDDIYRSVINDEVVPGPIIGESTETRSMSSFANPRIPGEDIQLPIHKWQARSAVVLPNFNEIYEAGVNASVFGATLGWTHHRIAQRIVDGWSLLNLAGPRYYLRNATEDYIMYAMTSGRLASVQKGRRMSTALRETRGGKLRGANRIRSRKRTVDIDSDTASRWSAIKASFSEEDIAKAQAALEAGDVEAVRKIAAIAIGRMKFSGMSGVETSYFLDYITLHGEKMIDEIAGTTTYGSSASAPVAASAARGAVDAGGKSRIIYPGKEFADVPLDGNDPFRFWYWHRNLQGTVDKDGVIGQIAVTNLDKSDDEIVPLIVRALEEDEISKVDNYKEILASLNHPGETYETFARRYVADVRNLFSGKEGQLNRDLWNKVVTVDEQGNRVARMLLKDSDETKFAVEVSDLMDVPNNLRPRNVLGREPKKEVPTIRNMVDFEKWWQVMGDQYAVFSREPIFFANYIEARKMLAPLEKGWTEQFGEEFTKRRLAQIATDRAYLNTLSYTDNPLNRTMLAWNSRNVARYYRATEDFARRMLRVGRNYPQGFWKVALTYDALDETGFVWTDENSQKFFVFPGSDALVKALNFAFQILPGNLKMLQFDNADMELRGMVTMIAPSTDPKQSIPSLSSPLAALPVKAAMNLFPSLRSFEQALLGEYSEGQEWWASLVPGHLMRLMQSIDPDERQGIYAATIKDTIAVAAAANVLPGPDASDEENKKFLGEMQTLATTVLITRLIGGVVLNTTPRVAYNDVTQYARQRGFVDMHGALRQMIDLKAKEGAINPMAEALTQYVETFGVDAIPYSMSKYDTGNPWNTYSGRLSPPATEEARIWAIENNDLITDEKYQSGAVWLMPRRGDFNGDMYRYLVNMGMRTPSTIQEFFAEAQGVKGRWVYYQVKEAHDKRVSDAEIKRYEAVLAGDEERVKELDNLIRAYKIDWEGDPDDAFNIGAKAKMEADFPSLNFDTFELAENARPLTLLNEIIPTLKYVLEDRDKEPPAVAVNMMQAINTYNMYIVEIDSVEGTTRVENDRKFMLKTELTSILNDIGSRDENTQLFVDSILIPMVDRPESYVSLAGERGVL